MAKPVDIDSCWGAPIARLLHPTRIQIVERVRRAGQPLSAADLMDSFGGRSAAPRLERHLRQLSRLGILVRARDDKSERSTLAHPYRLANDLD